MTWTAGADKTTGALVTASSWNSYLGATGSLMETAVAKATTAGRLFRATGTNAIAEFSPPGCRVYHSTTQSISSGSDTAVAFDSEYFDNDTMHSTSSNTSRVTITTAGHYLLTAKIGWGAFNNGDYTAKLVVNGSTTIAIDTRTVPASAALPARTCLAANYKLAAADYVEVVVNQTSGVGVLVSATPEFGAAWLGPG